MPVQLPQEDVVVIPPVEQKIADKLWLTQLVFRSSGPTQHSTMNIQYQPWTGSADEEPLAHSGKNISVGNVFALAQELPKVAIAINAILEAIPDLIVFARSNGDGCVRIDNQ